MVQQCSCRSHVILLLPYFRSFQNSSPICSQSDTFKPAYQHRSPVQGSQLHHQESTSQTLTLELGSLPHPFGSEIQPRLMVSSLTHPPESGIRCHPNISGSLPHPPGSGNQPQLIVPGLTHTPESGIQCHSNVLESLGFTPPSGSRGSVLQPSDTGNHPHRSATTGSDPHRHEAQRYQSPPEADVQTFSSKTGNNPPESENQHHLPVTGSQPHPAVAGK